MKKIFGISFLKMTIFQKLFIGIVAMLILNIIIAYVGIASINKLENTSEILLKESNKYNDLQKLKLYFNDLQMPANDYLIHGNKIEILNFKKLDSITKKQLKECDLSESNHFNKHYIEEIENIFYEIEALSTKIFELKNPVGNPQGAIMMEIMDGNTKNAENKIDVLLSTSSSIISKYLNTNQTTYTRASRIIIFVMLIIMAFLVIGGLYYVQEITKPINRLSLTAKKVTLGDLASKVEVRANTNVEIGNFANLFNNMIGVLAETTIPKNYFNSIIDKMCESLIITNTNENILIVNKTTLDLLKYKEEELIGKSIDKILLGNNKKVRTTLREETVQNIYNTYYSKSDLAIPISFSKSFIYDNNNNKTGVLYLAFHQTENLDKKQESTEKSYKNKRNIKLIGKTPLTKRELEIIKLIVADFSSKEIADKLFISIRTVETHRKHIMEKLHTKSIIALVHYAIQNGLV